MRAIMKAAIHLCRWSDRVELELEEAIWHRDRARSLDPNLPIAHVASAWILVSERKYAAALATFDKIAQAAPLAGGNAFANLAVSKNNVGRSAEAEADLLRVIRVTPGDPQMDWWHFYLGVTYAYLDRYPEAADALRHGISLNPQFDMPYVYLAAVCIELGRTEEALAAIRQAHSLGTRWTIGTVKGAPYSGIGVGIDDARMAALWDGLRQAGLPE
jgi:tetratricopeptide (TPR) repeat protein